MLNHQLFHGATPDIFRNARELRRNMTKAEKWLWKFIRNKQIDGLRFRRQHPASTFILDFYCPENRLAIEVDGGIHNERGQKEYDRAREFDLNTLGIKVIRFSNEDVLLRTKSVLDEIRRVAKELRPIPDPSPGGEEHLI